MSSRTEVYENNQKIISHDIGVYEKRSILLSILRLLTFIVTIAGIVAAVAMKEYLFFAASAAFFFGFILLCIVHSEVSHNLEYLHALHQVNSQYICRIDGDMKGLYDIAMSDIDKPADKVVAEERFYGLDFVEKDHDYANDLDCFGKNSLFCLYNVSETEFGRRVFADELLTAPTKGRSVEELKERQELVGEFVGRISFMQSYQASARIGNLTKMPDSLMDFAKEGKKLPMLARIVYIIWILLWIFPLVMAFMNPEYAKLSCLGIMGMNLILWICGYMRNAPYFKSTEGMSKQASSLKILFEKLEKEDFESERLKDLVMGGAWGGNKASAGLFRLEQALFLSKLRSQPILALLLNCIFPLDFIAADMLGLWAETHGSELNKSINSLADIECMMCLANVAVASEHYTFPKFIESDEIEDNAYYKGVDVYHPLLQPSTVVANSIGLCSNIALITGSNMSGKTTMIRTVGVTSLLAYCGAPIPGKELTLGRMRIMTSMRIVDSLEESISTFKAELVRISGIISASKKQKPLLFLIDEIFRGTNSDDRTQGALTVLNKLSYPYITGMMTTHDYALIDHTDKKFKAITYYHFSETYTDDGITFDYKLTPGISRSSNAQYLMKLVGIK